MKFSSEFKLELKVIRGVVRPQTRCRRLSGTAFLPVRFTLICGSIPPNGCQPFDLKVRNWHLRRSRSGRKIWERARLCRDCVMWWYECYHIEKFNWDEWMWISMHLDVRQATVLRLVSGLIHCRWARKTPSDVKMRCVCIRIWTSRLL